MTVRKPVRIRRVRSYRDFPPDSDGTSQNSSVKAMALPSKRTVYVVKGVTSESDTQHGVSAYKSLLMIGSTLRSLSVPKSWLKDYLVLKSEYKKSREENS